MSEVVSNEDAPRALEQTAPRALEGFTPAPRPAPETETFRPNPNKEGLDYDDCWNPDCGARDLTPTYRIADRSVGYCCPHCQSNIQWRETRAGHERNVAAGLGRYSAGRRVGSAQRERYISTPSNAFRQNYERAFGHK